MTTILDTRRFRKGRSGREMPDEDLLVFGYACKLFRDDEKAQEAEQMLIPWNGDNDLLISRYDVRAQLTDESEFAMEGPFEREEKDEIERLCDEERERDLRDAEASDEEERQETEGRSYAGYRAVGFDYEEVKRDERAIQRPHDEEEDDEEDDDEMEPYQVPHGFLIPDHTQLPPSMKVHSIIEKTAAFVSGQGAQMEIMIKAKQASNPQFDFLSFGSPLNAYYKHLMQSIKNGTYTPVQPKDNAAENSSHKSSEDDDDDEYSLHPSLFAKRKSPHNDDDPDVGISTKKAPMLSALAPVTLKLSESRQSPKFSDTKSSGVLKPMSSYSSDASKPYFVSQERRVPPASAAYFQRPPTDVPQSTPLLTTPSLAPWHSTDTSVTGDDFAGQDLNAMSSIRPPPPSDVQAVIDKLAQYVVRNGGSFESVVAQKGDPRFAFLNSTHAYNGYYEWKKQELKRQMKVKSAKPEHLVQSAKVKVAAPKPADAKKIEVIRVTAVRPSVVARSGAETAKEKEEEEEEEEEVIEPIKEIIVKEGGYCIDGGDKSTQFQEERIRQERKRKAALFAAKLKEDQAKKDRNGKRDRRSRSRERSRSSVGAASSSSSSSSPRKSRRRRRSSNSSPDRDRHRHRHHRHHHRRHRHHHHHKKQKHRRRDKEADKDK